MVPPASDSGTLPGGAVERHVERVAAFAELQTQRRLAARRPVDRDDGAGRRRIRPTASPASARPPRCCASTAPDRRRARAAARRRSRRPSTAAWCASRSAPAARESAPRRRPAPGPETRPARWPARPATTRSRDARAEGERRRRERDRRGLGACPSPPAAGRATARARTARADRPARRPRAARPARGGYRPGCSSARRSRPTDRRRDSPASISRVTPAGSVSSIGWRGPNAGCGARHARCSADTGTVGACPTDAANAGATRIRVAMPGFVSSCDGSGRARPAPGTRARAAPASREAGGTRDDDRPIVRSRPSDSPRRAHPTGRHRRHRRLDRQRLDQLGLGQIAGRSRSAAGWSRRRDRRWARAGRTARASAAA